MTKSICPTVLLSVFIALGIHGEAFAQSNTQCTAATGQSEYVCYILDVPNVIESNRGWWFTADPEVGTFSPAMAGGVPIEYTGRYKCPRGGPTQVEVKGHFYTAPPVFFSAAPTTITCDNRIVAKNWAVIITYNFACTSCHQANGW